MPITTTLQSPTLPVLALRLGRFRLQAECSDRKTEARASPAVDRGERLN